MKLRKILLSTILSVLPFSQTSIIASELITAQNNSDIEEIRKSKITKTGRLVIKFCEKLKDYDGYVMVDNKKFNVSDADVIKPRKIVWKDTNLSKSQLINTDNLKARYFDEDTSTSLEYVVQGDCPATLPILPIIAIGIAIGAGSGGGSGSSTSN